MKRSRRAVIVVVAALARAGAPAAWRAGSDARARQYAVARRGASVMPFDLDRTTHVFQPRGYASIQTVVADDPSDREQVRLIRDHLHAEGAAFAQGDFGDPAEIHGQETPGLEILEPNYEAIALTFEPIPEGARITYRPEDPAVCGCVARLVRRTGPRPRSSRRGLMGASDRQRRELWPPKDLSSTVQP